MRTSAWAFVACLASAIVGLACVMGVSLIAARTVLASAWRAVLVCVDYVTMGIFVSALVGALFSLGALVLNGGAWLVGRMVRR